MKHNELDFFAREGNSFPLALGTTFFGLVFAIPAAIDVSLLFLLFLLIPVICVAGMMNHTDSFMGPGSFLWERYRSLPPDLKAQIPLSREWIRDSYPLLERHEQEKISDAVKNLRKIATEREKEEKRQLVAYKHILTAIEEVSEQANQEVSNLKQINDEGKRMLDAP